MDKFNTLLKSLIKAIGLDETKTINFKVVDNLIYFNYKGEKYKYYSNQCKIFRLSGKKYIRINWKDFADDNSSTGQKQVLGRSPPLLLI